MNEYELKLLFKNKLNIKNLYKYLIKIEAIKKEISFENFQLQYSFYIKELCHISCEWISHNLYSTINKNELKNFFWCKGFYYLNENSVYQHSWIEYIKNNKIIIIDPTISQFDKSYPEIYIGKKTNKFSADYIFSPCNNKNFLNYFSSNNFYIS